MKASQEVRSFIKGWEALRLAPYDDSTGVMTVGWGHALPPDAKARRYTLEECEELFEQDIAETEEGVDELLEVEIPQPCFDALVSFAFNLGIGRLKHSTLLRKINASDLDGAIPEFGRWVYAIDGSTGTHRRLEGLVKRRQAEAEIFEFGDYAGRP